MYGWNYVFHFFSCKIGTLYRRMPNSLLLLVSKYYFVSSVSHFPWVIGKNMAELSSWRYRVQSRKRSETDPRRYPTWSSWQNQENSQEYWPHTDSDCWKRQEMQGSYQTGTDRSWTHAEQARNTHRWPRTTLLWKSMDYVKELDTA